MNEDRAYRIFDRYMQLANRKYNKEMFCDDDMYFCKVFKANHQGFAAICKKHNVRDAYFTLCTRMERFDMNVLQARYKVGMPENEYLETYRTIQKYSKYGY